MAHQWLWAAQKQLVDHQWHAGGNRRVRFATDGHWWTPDSPTANIVASGPPSISWTSVWSRATTGNRWQSVVGHHYVAVWAWPRGDWGTMSRRIQTPETYLIFKIKHFDITWIQDTVRYILARDDIFQKCKNGKINFQKMSKCSLPRTWAPWATTRGNLRHHIMHLKTTWI